MKKHLLSILLVSSSIVACARRDPTAAQVARNDDFGTLNAAKIELLEEGGIAAFLTNHVVRHDDRAFVFTRRQFCTSCAPIDSASGTLTASASDSLFTLTWGQSPFALKDDYGTTGMAADMIVYTLRMTFDGTTKTVRADDGTMPPQMRKIVDAVHGIISAARK